MYLVRMNIQTNNKKCIKYDKFVDKYPILLMDNKIAVDYDNIIIHENRVSFNTKSNIGRINFASCWHDDGPESYVTNENKVLNGFYLPDISYIEDENGYKFSIDMFKNGFIRQSRKKVNVPKIHENNNENICKHYKNNNNIENDGDNDDNDLENVPYNNVKNVIQKDENDICLFDNPFSISESFDNMMNINLESPLKPNEISNNINSKLISSIDYDY